MSLQNKFLMIFGMLFLFFGLSLFAINRAVILPGFIRLEQDESLQNLNRVNAAINNEISKLDELCQNSGARDDACDFMATGSQGYKDSFLGLESFITGNLNMVCYLTPDGGIFWEKAYDLAKRDPIPLPALFRHHFPKQLAPLKWPDKDLAHAGKKGILLTPKGLLMISARPIIASDRTGPARGTLIMGRFLSDSLINSIKADTKADFGLHLCDEDLPLNLADISQQLKPPLTHLVKKSRNVLFFYSTFLSLDNTPAFLIEIKFPRQMTQQGLIAIRHALLLLIGAGFFIVAMGLILARKAMITPVIEMSRKTTEIEDGHYEARLSTARKDEVGKLSGGINTLAAKIEAQSLELERLSYLDGLTGVHNKRFFDQALDREWKRNFREKQYLSVLLCDVDYFKLFNDKYGYILADKCLQLVAEAIQTALKRPSDLAARYAGEKFIILLPATPPEGALTLSDTIRKKIHELGIKHEASPIDKYVTLSLGVSSTVPYQPLAPADLIAAAGKALQECKEKGRNRVVLKTLSQKNA